MPTAAPSAFTARSSRLTNRAGMRRYRDEVVGGIANRTPKLQRRGAFINEHPAEIVNIQHEYGLFGGERGEWLVDFLRRLEKPARSRCTPCCRNPTRRYLA